MKVYITEYAGDIEFPMECSPTLHEALKKIMAKGYGEVEVHPAADQPHLLKIVVYEADTETGELTPVWGFYGWHWTMPEESIPYGD